MKVDKLERCECKELTRLQSENAKYAAAWS